MDKKIKLSEAVSIGIGGMVGGGIFAVLGLAVALSQGGTPLAFAFAGFIAFLTSYAYAKLSTSYPSKGGTVTFVNKAFGRGIFSGGTNNLLWVSYIIMLSLYASAFGSYAPNLLKIVDGSKVDAHIYSSLIIIVATLINYYSVKVVGIIEKWAVLIKMSILIAFVGVGIYAMTQSTYLPQLSFKHYPGTFSLLTGGMVIFVAYEGFELIANVSKDIDKPKNIARAYYISIGIVIVLYIVIAIITVGTLSFKNISTAQDYVLAEAAKPILGQTGFVIITIAALISTFSAINATIYGGTEVNYEVGVDEELPHEFTKIFLHHPVGLLITSILTLIMVNTLNLESISTSGSAGFLLIFAIVNYSAFRKRKEIKANGVLVMMGAILCALAFIALLYQQFTTNLLGATVAVAIIVVCYFVETVYKIGTKEGAKLNDK